jgi:hypothetical protein
VSGRDHEGWAFVGGEGVDGEHDVDGGHGRDRGACHGAASTNARTSQGMTRWRISS